MDDFASGATISGNIFYRCPLGAIELGGGRGNLIEREQHHRRLHPGAPPVLTLARRVGWDRPPYRDRFPLPRVYADVDQESMRIPKRNTIRRNVIACAHDSFKGYWRAMHEEGDARSRGSSTSTTSSLSRTTATCSGTTARRYGWRCASPPTVRSKPCP